jgi:hypothetical protein
MNPTKRLPRKRPPFGFYVTLVFVGVFAAIAVGDRLASGKWGAGVGILCMVVMGLALIVVLSVYYSLESAYHRWKKRRWNGGDEKP